jgi:hypothetical protein
MNELERKQILLKAKIEFGPRYEYRIYNGGLGLTLKIHVTTREEAGKVRKMVPTDFEGIYTIITYDGDRIEEDEPLYLPAEESEYEA